MRRCPQCNRVLRTLNKELNFYGCSWCRKTYILEDEKKRDEKSEYDYDYCPEEDHEPYETHYNEGWF